MLNGNSPRESLWNSPRNSSVGRFNAFAGVNTDRRSRFEARSARRWGDWGILAFPLPLLWLDDGWEFSPFDEVEFVWPELVDLWP